MLGRDDAEEWTQALGQSLGGQWRQVALAQKLGAPEALGLTTEAWVRDRLGGYVRLSIPARREAVKELTAPPEDGGMGLSTRRAASILGVSQPTVVSDLQGDQDRSGGARSPDEGEADADQDLSPLTQEDAEALLDDGVRARLSDGRLAHQALGAIAQGGRLLVLDPEKVAEALGAERVADALRYGQEARDWFARLEAADPDSTVALQVAATEGNRRRIYDLNHAEKGAATWFDRQGQAFKKTGQFPLTIRVWRADAGGEGAWAEVRVPDVTRDELAAWVRLREEHLAGEQLNLDVFKELLRLWATRYPGAKTLREMCDTAGLDLLDLRFTA